MTLGHFNPDSSTEIRRSHSQSPSIPFHVKHDAIVFHGGSEPIQNAGDVDPAAVRRPHVVGEVLLLEEAEDRDELALDGSRVQGSRK